MFRITIDLTDSLASPEFDRLASFLETDLNIRHKYSTMKQDEILPTEQARSEVEPEVIASEHTEGNSANGAVADDWVSVKDKLPITHRESEYDLILSDDVLFLMRSYTKKLEYCFGYYDAQNNKWVDKLSTDGYGDNLEYYSEVEYWRELPKKPE